MDPGATLRRARQEKRLTMEQLARATKISMSNLRALEGSDFEHLPAAVYTRGFLRAYAREVGLDPEETVDLYMQQVEDALAPQAEADAPGFEITPHHGAHHSVAQHDSTATGQVPLRIQVDLRGLPRPAVAATALVVLVAVIVALVWRGGNSAEHLTTVAAEQEVEAATASGAGSDAVRAAHEFDDVLRIELKTTGPCWISASADRTPVLTRLLQEGESEAIEAKDELVIRVGDPSTLTLTINGSPVRSLGRAGVPVTVQINRENYRELLAS